MTRLAVLMAGGSGTRFWPKSSSKKPKQFLNLIGNRSLLSETSHRLKSLVPTKFQNVVTTKAFTAATRKEAKGCKIIAEPEARNTMAAVCLSIWQLAKKNPDSAVAVLPADAYVQDATGYNSTLELAFEIAETQDTIVCIGIKPTFPATGYGYIEGAQSLNSVKWTPIQRFVEKPELAQAESFLQAGSFLWNAGIFVFRVSVFLEEVRLLAPEFAQVFDSLFAKKQAPSQGQIAKAYRQLPKMPIDTALMEKTKRGVVIPGDFGWSDVGSWTALADVVGRNHPAGTILGNSKCVSVGSSSNIAHLEKGKALALIGVKDLIIVETENALLVCHKGSAQEIKQLVELLKADKSLKQLV